MAFIRSLQEAMSTRSSANSADFLHPVCSLTFRLKKPALVAQSTPFVIEPKYITSQMKDEAVDK